MPTDTSNSSTIGEELTITGNVSSKGKVHLNGQVQGDIHCVSLVLGENARLEGNAIAKDVVIGGRLKGSIRALHVTLQSKSYVEGDVSHKSLTIEQVAYFESKSCPSDDPLSGESAPGDGAVTKPQLVSERRWGDQGTQLTTTYATRAPCRLGSGSTSPYDRCDVHGPV
jgi:cytoskeletal protein CcmA (bactofilin family)